MERRPAPEITIEGGQGWQLGDGGPTPDAASDVLDAEPSPVRRRLPRGLPLVLAAALGFAAATVVADARQTTLAESSAGVLSLDLRIDGESLRSSLVATADGQPAVSATASLRNTGAEPVSLESAELLGTPYRSEDLAGRRLDPKAQTVVALLRAVDCDDLSRTRAPGPLRVTGTTAAGSRTVDLRMPTDFLQFHDEQVQAACGQASPSMALIVMEQQPVVEGGTAVLTTELSNGSAGELVLSDLRPMAGLRLVRLEDEQRRPVRLPLSLPPGDFDPPAEPFQGRGPAAVLRAVLEVADCGVLQQGPEDLYSPLIEASVQGSGPTGSSAWGGDPSVVERLREASCAD